MTIELNFNKYLKGNGSIGILVTGRDEYSALMIEFSFIKWIFRITIGESL